MTDCEALSGARVNRAVEKARIDVDRLEQPGGPPIPRRLGFRSGEQATLSLVEVRQDCRFAPTQRIFIEHPSSYDAALSSGIPIYASNRNSIQLFPDGRLNESPKSQVGRFDRRSFSRILWRRLRRSRLARREPTI